MDTKTILKSKTFWANVLTAVVLPFLPEGLKNPETVGYAITAVNILLRLISKDKVTLI